MLRRDLLDRVPPSVARWQPRSIALAGALARTNKAAGIERPDDKDRLQEGPEPVVPAPERDALDLRALERDMDVPNYNRPREASEAEACPAPQIRQAKPPIDDQGHDQANRSGQLGDAAHVI